MELMAGFEPATSSLPRIPGPMVPVGNYYRITHNFDCETIWMLFCFLCFPTPAQRFAGGEPFPEIKWNQNKFSLVKFFCTRFFQKLIFIF